MNNIESRIANALYTNSHIWRMMDAGATAENTADLLDLPLPTVNRIRNLRNVAGAELAYDRTVMVPQKEKTEPPCDIPLGPDRLKQFAPEMFRLLGDYYTAKDDSKLLTDWRVGVNDLLRRIIHLNRQQ